PLRQCLCKLPTLLQQSCKTFHVSGRALHVFPNRESDNSLILGPSLFGIRIAFALTQCACKVDCYPPGYLLPQTAQAIFPVQSRITAMKLCSRLAVAVCVLASVAWGSVAQDATASKDSSSAVTTITTGAFSTKSPNELLLAFISSDANSLGVKVNNVT